MSTGHGLVLLFELAPLAELVLLGILDEVLNSFQFGLLRLHRLFHWLRLTVQRGTLTSSRRDLGSSELDFGVARASHQIGFRVSLLHEHGIGSTASHFFQLELR